MSFFEVRVLRHLYHGIPHEISQLIRIDVLVSLYCRFAELLCASLQ